MTTLYFDIDANFAKATLPAIYDETATTVVLNGTIAGPGTVTTLGSTTLQGLNTHFLSNFRVGDTITVTGETIRTIASITSDTILDVTVPFSTSSSLLTYIIGGGARFPAIADGPYNVVWWDSKTYPDPTDDPNAEIVRVVARVGDTLTITRAQENTVATPKNSFGGIYTMTNALTKFVMDQIRTAIGNGNSHIIQDNGVQMPYEPILNFLDYFILADNTVNQSTDISINTTELANDITFVNALIANTYFTTNLANNANFLSILTNNSTFISNVTNNVAVTGAVAVDINDTAPSYLDPKLYLHSSDGSVAVSKTIVDLGSGNERIEYDLTTIGGGGTNSSIQIDQTPDNGSYGLLLGLVDGFNTTFQVSTLVYAPGKLIVYVNGLAQELGTTAPQDWVETDPTTGTFDFIVPPLATDVITVEYLQTAGATLQSGIVFDDQTGAPLNLPGVITEFEITGPSVTANVVGSKVTYTIGASGSGAANLQVDQKPDNGTYGSITGAIDGTNRTFQVSANVYQPGKLVVYRNGVARIMGAGNEWEETDPTTGVFTFTAGNQPLVGETLMVEYQTSNVASTSETQIDQTPDNGTYNAIIGAVDGLNTDFQVSQLVYLTGKLEVYLNGFMQLQGASDDWVELSPGSGTFRFNTAPAINDVITVVYQVVGAGGIITSINGDSTPAQTIVGGTDISVNTVGGVTTIAYTGTGGGSGGANVQIDAKPDDGTYGTITGAINGINTQYTVSLGVYQAGKMTVYLNGVEQNMGATNGNWVETDPTTGKFDFNVAPETGDTIVVEYQTSSGGLPGINNLTLIDDFIGGYDIVTNTNKPYSTVGELGWKVYASGGPDTYITSIDGEANHPGILQLGSSSYLTHIKLNTFLPLVDGSEYRYIFKPNFTVGSFYIGLSPTPTLVTDSNKIVLRVGPTSDFQTADNGGTIETTAVAGITTGNWYNLLIKIVSGGTAIECWIDGVLVATHSTHIPLSTVASHPLFYANSNYDRLDIDYFSAYLPNITR